MKSITSIIFCLLFSAQSLSCMGLLENLGYSAIQKTSTTHKSTGTITDRYSIYYMDDKEEDEIAYVTCSKNQINELNVCSRHRDCKIGSLLFLHALNEIKNMGHEQAIWVAERCMPYYKRFGASPRLVIDNETWIEIKEDESMAYEKYQDTPYAHMFLDFKKVPNPHEYYDNYIKNRE